MTDDAMTEAAVTKAAVTDEALLDEAVRLICRGEVIGLPTETVYGLAADASNANGIASIYRIKGRPTDHPLIVHVADGAMAAKWGVWNDDAARVAAACWPGPLTMVLLRRPQASALACAGQPTIALRVPAHPVALALLRRLHAAGVGGLAAPSANRFGRISPTSAAHVRADLGDEVPLVLDGDRALVGIESTIIDLSGAAPRVLRPGHVSATQLAAVLGCDPRALEPAGRTDDAAVSVPRVPGTHLSHYAPVTPLRVVGREALEPALADARRVGRTVAVWSVAEPEGTFLTRRAQPLSIEGLERDLYAALRALDAAGASLILVERPAGIDASLHGIDSSTEGIADRLRRASASALSTN